MEIKFQPLEHPSDVGIIAFGKNTKELCENSAFGMFSLMADLSRVEKQQEIIVKAEGDNYDSLLVNWLNELIFYQDSKKILLKEFIIKNLSKNSLEGTVSGEKINMDKHFIYRPIKAATYNQLQIDENQARIVFDV